MMEFQALHFDEKNQNSKLQFWYEKDYNSEYLNLLLSMFPIQQIIKKGATDIEKIIAISNHVHKLWQHDGNNKPEKSDAISILQEVKQGKHFRCVEYSIVAAAYLNASGLCARVLNLKTKDAETTKFGAGHVVTEVYLSDFSKWAMLDVQFDALPILNNVPLSAVEFQKAIAERNPNIEIRTNTDLTASQYISWIYPYLYYFNVAFDNRNGTNEKELIDGKTSLMLVPLGAKNPTVFQIEYPIDYCIYTNSVKDFYASPK